MDRDEQYSVGFDSISKSKSEANRLDGLNASLRDYFGGRLAAAPIDHSAIKSVLELGAGSGAWTLDAATALPDAQIVACDIAPLPESIRLPPNVLFRQLDVSEPLPFERESFDLIHARLLFLKEPVAVIQRAVELLKPGGWIVLTEPDDLDLDDDGAPRGLAKHARIIAQQAAVFRQRGLDLGFGRRLADAVRAAKGTGPVDVCKLDMPFTGSDHDKKLLALGQTYKNGLLTLVRAGVDSGRPGFTQELYDETSTAMEDADMQPFGRLYVVWAQKTP